MQRSDRELIGRRPIAVDIDVDDSLGQALCRMAGSGATNVLAFSASTLPRLPLLLPPSWQGVTL